MKTPFHQKTSTQWLLLLSGMLISAALLTEILLYSQNTLLLNGRWIVEKRMLGMLVMGGDEFLLGRSPLSGNALNLGEWSGFQQVVVREPATPTEIDFKFQIPQGSYLDLLYDGRGDRFSGIRFSSQGDSPSVSFVRDFRGKFLSVTAADLPRITPGGHEARLSSSAAGISLSVDGGSPAAVDRHPFSGGQIGFGAGQGGATVAWLKIWRADKLLFEESFRNSKRAALLFLGHLALLMLLSLGVFTKYRGGWARGVRLQAFLFFEFSILLCLFYGFDFFYWSRLPFRPQMKFVGTQISVPQFFAERIRAGFFHAWARAAGYDLDFHEQIERSGYPAERIFRGPIFCSRATNGCKAYANLESLKSLSPRKSCKRILFMGTSQTVGAGADSLEDTFFAKTHAGLSQALAPGCIESLNISISGPNLNQLNPELGRALALFPPDMVLANFSNNDAASDFFANLSSTVAQTKRAGADAVFVEEANNVTKPNLSKKHEIMRAVAKQYGVPVFPLHDCLQQPGVAASGVLWWDYVHLSSYGQALTARWLVPWLTPLLRAKHAAPERLPSGCEWSAASRTMPPSL